jgi:hypothetical protein
MKSTCGPVRKFLTLIAALAVTGSAISLHAEKNGNGAAKVIRLTGSARFTTDQKTWKELKKGTVLKSGTLVQTAPNCTLDLCLNEARPKKSDENPEASTDNVIRVFENSALSLDKLAAEELQLDLRSGAIMGTVGKLTPEAKYEIRLPHGIIGIRGGTYITDVSGVVNVIEGSAVVVIVSADNSMATKKLSSRQGYDPTTGAVVPLHLDKYPPPLTCSGSESPSPNPTPSSGLPHGSGVGGALRKF